MTSSKPYLIRAFYDWILDNHLTPHVVINAEHPKAQVPFQHVEEGQIVLNVSPTAALQLVIGNEFIEFNARFAEGLLHVSAPIAAILAIYARENGRGMVFNGDEFEDDGSNGPSTPPAESKPSGKKPKLTIVK